MLVLARMVNESVVIDLRRYGLETIEITILSIRGDNVRLGIDAIREIPVHRLEIHQEIERGRDR